MDVSPHISVDRAWEYLKKSEPLSDVEQRHVSQCSSCFGFLTTFFSCARAAGFTPPELATMKPRSDKQSA
jgi:hypothetical protein